MSRPLPGRILAALPPDWRARLAGVSATRITTGLGGAEVFRLRTEAASFLKFASGDAAPPLKQEIARRAWLAARGIPVAPIIASFANADIAAMLTRALPGRPADCCNPAVLPALGRALARLHALPPEDCPFDESLAVRLQRARAAVAKGEVHARHFAP